MGDGALSPNISDSAIDYDLIHELLFVESVYISTQPKIMADIIDASLKRRLAQAMCLLRETIKDKDDVLVQIWVAVRRQGRQVLTASDQPFSLSPSCRNLASYRDASLTFQFAAEAEFVGLLGRVFLHRLPEWTPDVRLFRREEYPRVGHAQECDVRGSLALPVLERGSGVCLGVVEIVTTQVKLDFHPELLNVCKALEAVDLNISTILSPHTIAHPGATHDATLAELRAATHFACSAYRFPLAQVWAPCLRQRRRGGCRHSDANYARCLSTVDSACCVADPAVAPFHAACSHHHLLRGEGLPGRAFLTNQSCYAADVAAFTKTEYPLAHHARVFDLRASAAVRLRSVWDNLSDFVLEFFLPLDCRGASEQTLMLRSLSSVIQEMCGGLRVITDEELFHDRRDDRPQTGSGSGFELDRPSSVIQDMCGGLRVITDEELCDDKRDSRAKTGTGSGFELDHPSPVIQEMCGGLRVITDEELADDKQDGRPKTGSGSGFELNHPPPLDSETRTSGESLDFGCGSDSFGGKMGERKHKRSDKVISLEVLRQHFAGSLKEAAKSIGVCPTTLKRICRHHGITRWPSRKIKKVGRSLRKLQLVIDSVQDGEGPIQLSSFYDNFPHLVSPNLAGAASGVSSPKINEDFHHDKSNAATTSSSGSHTSSSSNCCSTGVKHSSFPETSYLPMHRTEHNNNGGPLKKARSDAELVRKGHNTIKTGLMIRSNSQHGFLGEGQVARPGGATQECAFRARVAFGEEKIRLSLQPDWDFKHLREEILARFSIDSVASVSLKYLDDDAEWVLLTCDDDLEECRDIHRSSTSPTIKLSVNQTCPPNLASSFGSDGPSLL